MKDFNFQNIIMNKNINSYTYLIGWSTLNKFYYGVRTAKNCNPKELFVSYFTSSKYVKKFIKQFGNPDIIQIRKTFNDKLKALEWEEKVINRLNMVFRDDFLNCGNGGKLFNSIGRTTVINKKTGEQYSISCEEYYNNKELYENAFAGERNPWYGKPLPEEIRQKLSNSLTGKKRSEESKEKQRNSILGNKNHFYGKTHSDESKKLMSISGKGKHSGILNPNYGKPLSDDVKKKLSDKMIGRFAGEKNPNYGKHFSEESKEKQRNSAKNRKRVVCEYCNLELDISNYNRWHGEKCKHKI